LLSSLEIVPSNQKKPAYQAQMLEERVLDHEAVRHRELPEAVSNERCNESEPGEPQRADPSIVPLRIKTDAPSSVTIVAMAIGTAGANPKCCASLTAPLKSRSFWPPP